MYSPSMHYDSSAFNKWQTPLYTQFNHTNNKLKPKEIMLYKTEACRNWTELGSCRYGKKCRYAHGDEELRSVPRHTRYKTQICRAYHTDGSCPYGIRCTFIHDSDGVEESEIKSNNNHNKKKNINKKSELEPTIDNNKNNSNSAVVAAAVTSPTTTEASASPIMTKPVGTTTGIAASATAEPPSLIWHSMLGLTARRRGSLESTSQGSETGSEESISLDFPNMNKSDYLSTFMMKQQPIETMQHYFSSQNRSIWM